MLPELSTDDELELVGDEIMETEKSYAHLWDEWMAITGVLQELMTDIRAHRGELEKMGRVVRTLHAVCNPTPAMRTRKADMAKAYVWMLRQLDCCDNERMVRLVWCCATLKRFVSCYSEFDRLVEERTALEDKLEQELDEYYIRTEGVAGRSAMEATLEMVEGLEQNAITAEDVEYARKARAEYNQFLVTAGKVLPDNRTLPPPAATLGEFMEREAQGEAPLNPPPTMAGQPAFKVTSTGKTPQQLWDESKDKKITATKTKPEQANTTVADPSVEASVEERLMQKQMGDMSQNVADGLLPWSGL